MHHASSSLRRAGLLLLALSAAGSLAATEIDPRTAAPLPPLGFAAFADPELDALIDRALRHNDDLAAAAARVDQARALAGATRAAYYPQLAVDAGAVRGRVVDPAPRTGEHVQLPGLASWELDLWGRNRNAVRAARAEAGMAAADYAAAQVSLAAEVAETHFTRRAVELEVEIVERSVLTRQQARRITADRVELGTRTPLELARAETELAQAEADLAELWQRRANLTHALALLTGASADQNDALPLPPARGTLPAPPPVPFGLSTWLLQQRPDLQRAQLALDAAGARIGVARAAFFPTLSLTGSAGWESADFSQVISGDARVWSFGPRLYLPLFQGGRNRANLTRAEAVFAEQSALYRHAVQRAFREVRDALSAERHLAERARATERAALFARRAAELSRTRYEAGAVGYLEVIDADRAALETERAAVRLQGQRLVATTALLRALGGGWEQPN